MPSGIRLLLLAALSVGPVGGTALAAEPAPAGTPATDLARAKELYENGALLYEEGNYQGAILAFQASFDLSHAPALHYNLANCYERLGRLTEARDALNLYRAVAPSEERERLERRVANLEARLKEEAVVAAAVPAPTAGSPTTTPATGSSASPGGAGAKWALVGVGAGVAAGGGVLAYLGYAGAESAYVAGDRDSYTQSRTLNGVGYGVAGLGVATAVVGLALPSHRADAVSLSPVPTAHGLVVLASAAW